MRFTYSEHTNTDEEIYIIGNPPNLNIKVCWSFGYLPDTFSKIIEAVGYNSSGSTQGNVLGNCCLALSIGRRASMTELYLQNKNSLVFFENQTFLQKESRMTEVVRNTNKEA